MSAKQDRTAIVFLTIVEFAMLGMVRGEVLREFTDEEVIVFHKMHGAILEKAKGKKYRLLQESYPFVKVNGRFLISQPKIYLYLRHAKYILATFKHPTILAASSAIYEAQEYCKNYRQLDERLILGNYQNIEDYQAQVTQLYEEYITTQMDSFDRLKTPV